MVPNIKIVKEVCEDLGLDFSISGDNDNLLTLSNESEKYFFAYTTTPFNTEDIQHIATDKSLIQECVSGKVEMPRTKKYLRPDLDPNWHDKIEFGSEGEICSDIEKNFTFPCIVKMNAGSLGRNVFTCKNASDIKQALEAIFKEDWALLAQERVDRDKEFRVIIVGDEVELAYYKGGDEFFTKETKEFKEVKNFLEPLKNCLTLNWAGLDVIRDKEGKLWLIEINTRPSFSAAFRTGHKEEVKNLYKKALKNILGI